MNTALPRLPASEAFQGSTYSPQRDHKRLSGQLRAVFDVMKDGRWRTLTEIAGMMNRSTASISARLRDLRKDDYGAHTVDREHVGNGVWRYRLIVNREQS